MQLKNAIKNPKQSLKSETALDNLKKVVKIQLI